MPPGTMQEIGAVGGHNEWGDGAVAPPLHRHVMRG